MPTEPAFRLDETFSGLFTTASLGDLLSRQAAEESIANMITGRDGEIVSVERLELVQTVAGWELRIGNVRFVADGTIHRCGPLAVAIDSVMTMLALEWSIVRLSREHFSHRGISATLVAKPVSATAIPLVKLVWADSRPTIDASWWPEVERVDADERSSQAARALIDNLPANHPDAVFLRLRRSTLTWNTLISLLLRHLPATTALDAGPKLCTFVRTLTEALAATYALPPTINGRIRDRFGQPSATRNDGGCTVYSFDGVSGLPAVVSIGLAVEPDRETCEVEWTAIPANGDPVRRPFDATPAELTRIDPCKPFQIRLRGGRLKSLGYYVELK